MKYNDTFKVPFGNFFLQPIHWEMSLLKHPQSLHNATFPRRSFGAWVSFGSFGGLNIVYSLYIGSEIIFVPTNNNHGKIVVTGKKCK